MPANCVNINIRLFSIVDLKMANTAVKQLTAAYESVGQYPKRGLHPEEFLTYDFLCKHPILLQPRMLRVDWNRIPGLTRRITTIPHCRGSGQFCGPVGCMTGRTLGSRTKIPDTSYATWLWWSAGAGSKTTWISKARTDGYIRWWLLMSRTRSA